MISKLIQKVDYRDIATLLTHWLGSRAVILVAMLVIAPALGIHPSKDAVQPGFFVKWDGLWYEQIATTGYDYALDNQPHAIAFFPLYPLLCRAVMALGLPFSTAGVLVSNAAFLAAVTTTYFWVKARYKQKAAGWTTAVLCWCPLSLYGTVAYTEGLFLLLSALTLFSFDSKHYKQAAMWGALTTATRLNGITLVPSLLLTAWVEQRRRAAYFSAILAGSGLLLFIGYCAWQFGNPLAFLSVQAGFGHRSGVGFPWQQWLMVVLRGLVGPIDMQRGLPKQPLHIVQVVLIAIAAYSLWRFRFWLSREVVPWAGFVLLVWLWLLWGDSLVKLMLIGGGGWLLWKLRRDLPVVVLAYGGFSLLLVLFSGSTVATDRFTYAIVSLAIAAGLYFSRNPRLGRPVVIYFAVVLANFAVRFARNLWVA